ncbi:MAG: hypothetical protein AAF415_14550 [Pseudomonadota bacterium]
MEKTTEQKQEWSAPELETAEMSEATRGGVFFGRPICDRFPNINACQS